MKEKENWAGTTLTILGDLKLIFLLTLWGDCPNATRLYKSESCITSHDTCQKTECGTSSSQLTASKI